MKNGIERRRHIRAPLTLDAVLHTSKGKIEAKTADISVSGLAVILVIEEPDLGDEFQLTLKTPADYEMSIFCAKVWSGKMITGETTYNAIGAEFIKISPENRKILVSLIVDYYRD